MLRLSESGADEATSANGPFVPPDPNGQPPTSAWCGHIGSGRPPPTCYLADIDLSTLLSREGAPADAVTEEPKWSAIVVDVVER
jgi:hypothetical protein